MIKPDQIPDEVVEALLAHLNTCECRECTAETIAAMLNAWPGMDTRPNIYGRQDAILILPLPTEASDE